MATTPEGRVKAKIKTYLKSLPDCWFFMPIGGAYSTHGVPDIVGVIRGEFFAIECKAPGKLNNTTHLQDVQLASISRAGGFAMVADHLDLVREAFKERGWSHD